MVGCRMEERPAILLPDNPQAPQDRANDHHSSYVPVFRLECRWLESAGGGLPFEFRNPGLERGQVRPGEARGDGLRAVSIVAHDFDEEEAFDLAAQRG